MMREVLTRRFKRLAETRKKERETGRSFHERNASNTWGIIPDLVIIDGGKGHLGAALQVFLELGIDDIPLCSLAKENEELFVPYEKDPIVLPRDSQGYSWCSERETRRTGSPSRSTGRGAPRAASSRRWTWCRVSDRSARKCSFAVRFREEH